MRMSKLLAVFGAALFVLVGCGGGGASFGPVPTGDTSTPLGSQAIRIQFSSPTAPAGQQTQTFTVIMAVTP